MALRNVVIVAVCLTFGCVQGAQVFTAGKLMETLQGLNLTVLVGYLKKSNLDKTLEATNSATVFAPTDDAFKKLRVYLTDEELVDVLKAHVVDGYINSTVAAQNVTLHSIAKSCVIVKAYNFTGKQKPFVVANGAVVSMPDFQAINGIVHVIDSVMYPLVNKNAMAALSEVASVTAGYVMSTPALHSILSNPIPGFTFFAPSNAAWSRLPFGVLKNLTNDLDLHILLSHLVNPQPFDPQNKDQSGPFFSAVLTPSNRISSLTTAAKIPLMISQDGAGSVLVNDTKVVRADIATTDLAVIHVIDKVLLGAVP